MNKKIFMFSGWILWIVSVIFFISIFARGKKVISEDKRIAILLNPSEKELVLSEMRTLLTVIHETLILLSKEDYNAAAKKSKEGGMDLVENLAAAEKSILLKIPIEFKKLGFGTHEAFDNFSKSILEKKPYPILMKELGELTSRCVACHSAYKLELEK
ncbi:MAG: hypothetical protein L6Q54_03765 [Leptospiraceae bacterium]|nr:hypothetical protein [Leptospiraceae bacterium]MCK6380352.1 hypothetical protein [Leptospiraceae bacterium]NUM40875.1 hypothetical protein [Leptospiraceae bacterium]